MGSKILIADDNDEIREIVNVLLSSEGYEIIEAKDGEEACQLASDEIDLIILDIMMPKMNGYQVCKKIREQSNVPILFLTAKGMDSDKTLGFSSGGDDYLAKPFSYNELTARVKALLRRYQVYQGKGATPLEKVEVLKVDEIELYLDKEQVYVKGKLIALTDIEYHILCLLMKNQRQIFSAADLYEKIWNEPYYYSANNTVMVHIRNLRKKLEEDANHPLHIKTVWGKGYRFE